MPYDLGAEAGVSSQPLRILLVDDDGDGLIHSLLTAAEGERYALEQVSTYEAALQTMARRRYDTCLVVHRPGVRDGLRLLREARRRGHTAPLVLLTEQDHPTVGVEAIQAGAADHLVKSQLDAPLLARTIRYAIERERLRATLAYRSTQLQTAAEVSKFASTILDPEALMAQTVHLIQERFDLYYVGIYLLDETGKYVVLRAGTGGAGRKMIEAGYRLVVGGLSMVGWCVATATARITQGIGRLAARPFNPYLPDTRSEMALPLVSRGRCIGALAVQSKADNAFSQEDIALLQTMADQVAIAIENARLYDAAQDEIVERMRAETALRQSMTLYRAMFEKNQAIKLLIDPMSGAIVDANSAACAFYGYTLDELRTKKITEIDTLPAPQVFARMAKAVSEEATSFIFRHRLASGEVRDVEVHSSPLEIEGRRVLYSIIHDITERKRAEEERERLIAELDAFAHTVAHDLKNPLNLITGFTSALKDDYPTMTPEELEHYLRLIGEAGQRMNNIIDELLLLARMRQDDDLEIHPLNMAEIVFNAHERLSFMAASRNAEIVLPARWPVALGHGPWVEEIWANYLSNALKYGGDPPRLELGTALQTDGMVRFWVRDNGRGLTAEERERLFMPFTRLDRVRAKGHGLGLSIVRRIAERLGGEVGVESEIGQGSTFSFTLPGAGDETNPIIRLEEHTVGIGPSGNGA